MPGIGTAASIDRPVMTDVEDAVDRARVLAGVEVLIVVTGSLYAVGEARAELV